MSDFREQILRIKNDIRSLQEELEDFQFSTYRRIGAPGTAKITTPVFSPLNAPSLYDIVAGEDISEGNSVQLGLNRGPLFIAAHDARVDETNPATNYGSTDFVIVGGSAPNEQRAYIKFDLSGLPVGNLTSATFYMYINASGAGVSFEFYPVTSADWTEGAITWNNKPTGGSQIGSNLAIGVGDIGTWKSHDMTSTVASWLNGATNNYGFFILSNTANQAQFRTSEYATANQRNYLELVFDNTKLFKADAIMTENTTKWIGFCTNDTTAGDNARVQLNDIFATTGLTAGSIYYLSDTRGAISTSPGTVSKKVGLALSTTDLFIDRVS